MSPNVTKIIGWLASGFAIVMFVAYIDQIALNLSGNKGSVLQPAAAVINCSLWLVYGISKRDWPIIIANFPGVVLALVTVITAL